MKPFKLTISNHLITMIEEEQTPQPGCANFVSVENGFICYLMASNRQQASVECSKWYLMLTGSIPRVEMQLWAEMLDDLRAPKAQQVSDNNQTQKANESTI